MVVASVKPLGLMKGAQTDFYLSEKRFPALVGGRGAGKTWALCLKAYNLCLKYPGIRGVLTEPTFDMIRRNLVPVWEKQFKGLGGWGWRIFHDGVPSEIAFANGSVIDLRPATADQAGKFEGPTYGFGAMDEIKEGDQFPVFMAMVPSIRAPETPQQLFVATTPERIRPWIRRIWTEKVSPITREPLTAENYPKFRAETDDNYNLDKETKALWHELYGNSRLADQMLRGLDVPLEGVAFEDFTEAHIGEPPPGTVFKRILAGLDFGATSPTSMHEIRLDTNDDVWITREFYKRNVTDYDWIGASGEWNISLVVCDPSRADKELEEMRRKYGVRIQRARPPAKRFEERVRLLRTRLAPGTDGHIRFHVSRNCPNAINEIQNLAFAEVRLGEWQADRWEAGSLDHAFDDICYGLSEIDLPSYEYHPTSVRWFGREMRAV